MSVRFRFDTHSTRKGLARAGTIREPFSGRAVERLRERCWFSGAGQLQSPLLSSKTPSQHELQGRLALVGDLFARSARVRRAEGPNSTIEFVAAEPRVCGQGPDFERAARRHERRVRIRGLDPAPRFRKTSAVLRLGVDKSRSLVPGPLGVRRSHRIAAGQEPARPPRPEPAFGIP